METKDIVFTFAAEEESVIHLSTNKDNINGICGAGTDDDPKDVLYNGPIVEEMSNLEHFISTHDYSLCQGCKLKQITEFKE